MYGSITNQREIQRQQIAHMRKLAEIKFKKRKKKKRSGKASSQMMQRMTYQQQKIMEENNRMLGRLLNIANKKPVRKNS